MTEQNPSPGGDTHTPAASDGSAGAAGLTAKKSGGRGRRNAIIAGATAVVLLGGGGVAWAAVANSAPADDTAAAGEFDTDAEITVGQILEPDNLDIRATSGVALDQILIDNVYEGLVSRGANGAIEPKLATDYSISDDGLTYSFELADDVVFHNGDPLTVDDVLWSLNTVKDDETIQGHSAFANVQDVSADGDSTIEITLAQPNADFLWSLTGRAGLVLDEDADNDLSVSAVGTGPFVLNEGDWVQGDSITLTRNDDYWGDAAGVAAVTVTYYSDANALANALKAGEIQAGAPSAADARSYEGDDDWEVIESTSSATGTIAFNSANGPLQDVRVRQALRYGFDKEALRTASDGLGQLIGGPIPPADPGYEDLTDLFPYDPDKAKELLAEAGYGDGLELTLTIPAFYGATLPDLLTSQYAEIGVTLKVDSVEFPVWLEKVHTNADYDLSYVLHAEARDFYNFAGRLSTSPELAAEGKRYYFNYENPEVDELYAESQRATDAETQADLLAQAARIVAEDSPADWTSASTSLLVLDSRIDGFPTNDLSARLNVTDVKVAVAD
ncbi:ABC transporter substrate-binding protein [Microbacterium saperdae]